MPYISYPIIGGENRLPYYVCGVGKDFCQNDIYRREGFPYPQFVISVDKDGFMRGMDVSTVLALYDT